MLSRRSKRAAGLVVWCVLLLSGMMWPAEQAAAQGAGAAREAAKKPVPLAGGKATTPARPAAAAAAAARAGAGWKTGPRPSWVVEPPPPTPGIAAAPNVGSRRDLLFDMQVNYALPKVQTTVRMRQVALDASALGVVSQPQITFNPAFQTVVLHSAAVWRDGQRLERLAQARIEPLRREQRLEQQVLDGTETLLVVLADVRVNEPVEVSWTLEGANPIFEGRIAYTLQLAWDAPIEQLHYRVLSPPGRELRVKALAGGGDAERFSEGGLQGLRVWRQQVAAITPELNTPPWHKIFPALHVSEYRNWAEVDAWAERLFALPRPAHAEVAARAAAFKASGLAGDALVSEVLRFVQDEVRYFSVSLGESSHRPKPAQQTLAERLGDCKDKVLLLNALLRELGFDPKPALVSVVRGRGLADYLPGHDQIDHVITRLDVGGTTRWLDATINGQGLTLAGRGQHPYGRALVVGDGAELSPVVEAPDAIDRLDFEQRWDLSQPGKPVTLTSRVRASGLAAERWRAGFAVGGAERLGQAVAGALARLAPALKPSIPAAVSDDRQANQLELTQTFELADFGVYSRGAIEAEFVAIELVDALNGPTEARRRMPALLDQPKTIESRIVVLSPQAPAFRAPAPVALNERHVRFSAALAIDGRTLTYTRRVERKSDEILPEHLEAFREQASKARQALGGRLRLGLVDTQALMPELERIERRLRGARGFRNDTLASIVARNEFSRHIDSKTLEHVAAGSPLAASVLSSRAQASNHVGDFAAALADAEAALAAQPTLDAALEARGVALVGLGRPEEALAAFEKQTSANTGGGTGGAAWRGQVALHLGRAQEAEQLLREVIDRSGGDEREFALIWLYLAAEQQQPGRGRQAIAQHVEGVDAKKLTGALLRYLDGRIDRAALLEQARERPDMERLNLAEAYFFIGRQLAASGKREEAMNWYRQAVDTQAVPYREVTFAQLELKRLAK